MVTRKTLLGIKEIQKGNLVSNVRPITCLSLIWRLLTDIFAAELYEHLQKTNLLPGRGKGFRKRKRGTKDQLLIDKMIVKDCKRWLPSLAVACIDYSKPTIWSHIIEYRSAWRCLGKQIMLDLLLMYQ